VLVVGAGPTGLTLACDLSRRGITSRIIARLAWTRRDQVQPKARGYRLRQWVTAPQWRRFKGASSNLG
jgi:2-polyprenyl-6-methoxyphenol hydroxylase-like FAD-dependent oxidoreductase